MHFKIFFYIFCLPILHSFNEIFFRDAVYNNGKLQFQFIIKREYMETCKASKIGVYLTYVIIAHVTI